MFNKYKPIFNSSFFLSIVFVSALFILIFISGVSYRYTTSLTDSSALMVHSYKIRSELEQLVTILKDAESGHRGFILTRDSLFLHPSLSIREKINKAFTTLRELTKNNFQQQKNLDSLNTLINLRIAILYNTLDISTSGAYNQDQISQSLVRGEQQTMLVREQVNDMIDFEKIEK